MATVIPITPVERKPPSPEEIESLLRKWRRLTPQQKDYLMAFGEHLNRRGRIRDAIARKTEAT